MKDILIIEDDVAIAFMLLDLLGALGYAVRHAANGQAGLAMLDRREPDLILCDVMMPILMVARSADISNRRRAINLSRL